MENIDFGSNDALQPESSQNATSRRGLTLVLPPLSAVKALKGKKKGYRGVGFQDAGVQKTPRPTKLKPLKEVLSKLIIQIKKCVLSLSQKAASGLTICRAGRTTMHSSSPLSTPHKCLVIQMSSNGLWTLDQ